MTSTNSPPISAKMDRIFICFNSRQTLPQILPLIRKFNPDHIWLLSMISDQQPEARKFKTDFTGEIREHYHTITLHSIDTDYYSIESLLQCIAHIYQFHTHQGQFFLDIVGGTTMSVAALYAGQLFDLHIVDESGNLIPTIQHIEVPQFPRKGSITKEIVFVLKKIHQYLDLFHLPSVPKSKLGAIIGRNNYISPKELDFRKLNSYLLPFISADLLSINQNNEIEVTGEGRFMCRIFEVYYGFAAYGAETSTLTNFKPNRRVLLSPWVSKGYNHFYERLEAVIDRIKPDLVYLIFDPTQVHMDELYSRLESILDHTAVEILPGDFASFEKLMLFLLQLYQTIQQHEIYLNITGGTHITLAFSYLSLLYTTKPVFTAQKGDDIVYIDNFMRLDQFQLHDTVPRDQITHLLVLSDYLSGKNQRKMNKAEMLEAFMRHQQISPSLSKQGQYAALRTILAPLQDRNLITSTRAHTFITEKGRLAAQIYRTVLNGV